MLLCWFTTLRTETNLRPSCGWRHATRQEHQSGRWFQPGIPNGAAGLRRATEPGARFLGIREGRWGKNGGRRQPNRRQRLFCGTDNSHWSAYGDESRRCINDGFSRQLVPRKREIKSSFAVMERTCVVELLRPMRVFKVKFPRTLCDPGAIREQRGWVLPVGHDSGSFRLCDYLCVAADEHPSKL